MLSRPSINFYKLKCYLYLMDKISLLWFVNAIILIQPIRLVCVTPCQSRLICGLFSQNSRTSDYVIDKWFRRDWPKVFLTSNSHVFYHITAHGLLVNHKQVVVTAACGKKWDYSDWAMLQYVAGVRKTWWLFVQVDACHSLCTCVKS